MSVSVTLLKNYPYLVLVRDKETGEESYKHAKSMLDIIQRFSGGVFIVLAVFKHVSEDV